MAANAIPILPQLDADAIREKLERHEFFWADLTLGEETSLEDLRAVFGLDDEAVGALERFGRGAPDQAGPRRRVHVDDEHVVFPFWCVGRPEAEIDAAPGALELYEVKVLLHGDYLVTVHERACDLTDLVGDKLPRGRSESYVVYVVLEAMMSTFFRALLVVQDEMVRLETEVLDSEGGARQSPRGLIRAARQRLSELRSVAGPERVLFERASGEMELVPGLEADRRRYFERIDSQLDRLIEGIDAANNGLSTAVEVQLNETTYRLTIVATIFLPLTFLTGFFGMNFDWMVGEVASAGAFWLLGVGGCLLALSLIIAFLVRQGVVSRPRPRAASRRSA